MTTVSVHRIELAVPPKCEVRGIGGAVLNPIDDWLFAAGNTRIWLHTGADPGVRAYQVYLQRGWQATSEPEDEDEL